jgi:secondary thiamine-phosphate synthase enzyme
MELTLLPSLHRLGALQGELRIETAAPLEWVDLTSRVEAFVRRSGLLTGLVNVQVRHTTAGIVVNEDEPLLREDLEALLERVAPRALPYAHDQIHLRPGVPPDERPNGHSHAKSLFLRASESINVANGELQLGRWQRVFLLELDGPRERLVSLIALGLGAGA